MVKSGSGILILSIGHDRRQMLFDAIASVRRHHPDIPVHVVSDVPVDMPFTWVCPLNGHASRYYKTQAAKLSPFETTLLLDDDAMIHRPLPPLPELLGGSDLAMARDAWWPTVNAAAAEGVRVRWCSEAEAKLTSVAGDQPHYNSGVIAFRDSSAVDELFAAWHAEWMRYQGVDQLSLARALRGTGVQVRELPAVYNCRAGQDTGGVEPFIRHFAGGERSKALPDYFKREGIDHAKAHDLYMAYANAVNKGICERHQYEAMAKLLHKMAPARVLIFGCGHDQELWRRLNAGGETLFLEHDEKWAGEARTIGCDVELVSYPTIRGVDGGEGEGLPARVTDQAWDFVFVDAPRGLHPGTPGRQLTFRWASELSGNPIIVAHDCERPWEKACALRYLEKPDLFLWGPRPHIGTLWFWLRGRASAGDLLT